MLKQRLKELRRMHRITQEELATAIGVERSSIGKYEGRHGVVPSLEVLISIADYFSVSTDYLLGRSITYDKSFPKQSLSQSVSEPGNSYTVSALNRKEFIGLTETEIMKLAIYAEGLKAGRSIE